MRNLAPVALCTLALFSSSCGPQDNSELKTGVAQSQQALRVCAAGTTVDGIDVSYYQGTIDWAAVAGSGLQFAITRINDGSYNDPQFGRNWSEIKANGMIRGAYQFFEPTDDPTWQANVAVNAVGVLGPGDLPVMLDVEWTSGSPTVSQLSTWLSIVEAGTGKRPMIYTAVGYWDQYFSGQFGDYPLVVANYGVTCPAMPDSWSNWAFWQWGGTTVPGISGNVDHDVWNGDLTSLKSFVGLATPKGWLDAANCDGIAGWAQDPKAPNDAIAVHVYMGGPAGSGAPGVPTVAGNDRSDLCTAIGSCNHGFAVEAPYALMDGQPHEIHAYGIDTQGGTNPELSGSPQTFTCAPALPSGVRRHVQGETDFAAWGFSSLMDVRPVSDADFAALTENVPLPSTPRLVQAAGHAEVYLIDSGYRRWVTDPASAQAWHFDLSHLETIDFDVLNAMPEGPHVTGRPLLVKGSGPAIDLLDSPFPPMQIAGAEPVAPPPQLATLGPTAKSSLPGSTKFKATGGCSATGESTLVFAAALVVFALSRRARRAGA
ncbi:MAG: GH25 family lysozyme [Myxococcaceae bacterium]